MKAILCTFTGVREMASLDVALADWLKPFVEKLGHKKRRQMCPVYISGRENARALSLWPHHPTNF